MKSLSIFILGFFMISAYEKPPQNHSLEQFEWLLGTWERTNTKVGSSAFEIWKKESDSLFSGIGFSMKGQDTTFKELLKLEIKEGQAFYVADVKENAEPTFFKIKSIDSQGFKAENPDHDFPKVIEYRLNESELTAVVSDGADQKLRFVFRKP